jgi:hypothetical protein
MARVNDYETAERRKVAIDLLLNTVQEVADRIERGIEADQDRQALLEDVLWGLDAITGRGFVRGVRLFDTLLGGRFTDAQTEGDW